MNLLRIDEETTANVGIVEGGQATNIVMPELKVVAEARSLNGGVYCPSWTHDFDIPREREAVRAEVEIESTPALRCIRDCRRSPAYSFYQISIRKAWRNGEYQTHWRR